MPRAVSNRLLPLLGGTVLLVLVAVTLRSCEEEEGSAPVLATVPVAPAPDADTPADTIKTLTANVAAMTSEVESLRRDNTQLRKANEKLLAGREQMEENVAQRLRREMLARDKDQANQARLDDSKLESLNARLDSLAAAVGEGGRPGSGSDIPIGLGFDDLDTSTPVSEEIRWILPLDVPAEDDTGLLSRASGTASGYLTRGRERIEAGTEKLESAAESARDRPVYTVPRNATLIGSTAMTALVGRIPTDGQVRDPMPFKVITGADNLAANGLRVPGVHGMIWSGTAVGDWTLSCVTGRLESVTFVFDDGTIRTVSSDDPSAKASQGGRNEPLGWISDAQGIPCISGERKSNAVAFLSQRIGIEAVQAASEAAAAAETTTVVGSAGGITQSVTGDVGEYVLGRTGAGGADAIAQWLQERQSQSFDAVFVPAGVPLAIHVDRELAIDYAPTGRKLNHESANSSSRHSRLD